MINFQDQNRSGSENDGKDVSQSQGQPSLSAEQLQQILAVVGQKDQSNDRQQQAPASADRPAHTLLGLSDSQLQKLQAGMGNDVAELILGALGAVVQKSESTDGLILQELQKVSDGLSTKFDAQAEQMKKLGSTASVDPMLSLGLNKVFTEENKDDVGEMLDIITERSGGLYNAKDAFNKAVENSDFEQLLQFKEKFQGFVESKYKDHESLSGGRGNSRSTLEQRNKFESEIDTLNKQIESLMSKGNVDYSKVTELQEQVREKAESLIN